MLLCSEAVEAQVYVRSVKVRRLDVFDSSGTDWFFGARLLNALHTRTRSHVIEDELLFGEGDEFFEEDLEETARNLRRRNVFARVDVSAREVAPDSVDVDIRTQDKWSTLGEVLYGTGGGVVNYGAALREENFLGEGINTGVSALYRTENELGWQGQGYVWYRRFLRSDFNLFASVLSNRIRTVQSLSLDHPFQTLDTRSAYGVSVSNSFGDDFLYAPGSTPKLLPYHLRRITAHFARATIDKDRYFWSVLVSAEDVRRLSDTYRQAFDNSGRVLFSLGSLRQEFVKNERVDGYETRDVAVGAWGQAVFGYLFPMKAGGERLTYVGARAEQSALMLGDRLYLYGAAEASSGFSGSEGRYTYVESSGIGHYRVNRDVLVTARFLQQTAWNWTAFRQLVLDNDMGLRGYVVNGMAGDNRFLANAEVRFFPSVDLWIFRLGAAAFYDGGMVWNQSQDFLRQRFRNAVGLGLRVFNTKLTGSAAVLRIDVAYNVDERRWAGIIITSDQLFSAFGSHTFTLPFLGGSKIDGE
ncbi:MAG: hypothetical protein ACKOBV_05730 [Candidatus Kapaibacterium sp.]